MTQRQANRLRRKAYRADKRKARKIAREQASLTVVIISCLIIGGLYWLGATGHTLGHHAPRSTTTTTEYVISHKDFCDMAWIAGTKEPECPNNTLNR